MKNLLTHTVTISIHIFFYQKWDCIIYCCPDCPSCIAHLNSISWATWATWAAIKKYNRTLSEITCKFWRHHSTGVMEGRREEQDCSTVQHLLRCFATISQSLVHFYDTLPLEVTVEKQEIKTGVAKCTRRTMQFTGYHFLWGLTKISKR